MYVKPHLIWLIVILIASLLLMTFRFYRKNKILAKAMNQNQTDYLKAVLAYIKVKKNLIDSFAHIIVWTNHHSGLKKLPSKTREVFIKEQASQIVNAVRAVENKTYDKTDPLTLIEDAFNIEWTFDVIDVDGKKDLKLTNSALEKRLYIKEHDE